jgi:sortase A
VHSKLQILGWTLIWSSLFIFGYVGYELVVTDLINSGIQAEAAEGIDEVFAEASPPPVEEVSVDDSDDDGAEVVEFHREDPPAEEGTEVGVLRVPRLGIEVILFEGVTPETLKKGPGHMPGTALPGQPGNAVISGHRTTHGRPFFDLDQLKPGDRIEVETSIGTHVYELREEWFLVAPTDVWVVDPKDGGWLTLTTCHPKFSARQRLIVTAELVSGPNLDYVSFLEDRLTDLS